MPNRPKTSNAIKNVQALLLWLCVPLMAAANALVFIIAPDERVMGAVQRIFYFHVAGAIACYFCFAVVFCASLIFLANRDYRADVFSEAAGEVGFIFCSITLFTGMIWGHSAWNTWFSWEEPRLVTFLVLWLIFLSFTILRNFGDPARVSAHASVLGIIGAVSVPLVYVSIKLLPKTAQLHPEVLEKAGLKHPAYWWAFGISVLCLLMLSAVLILVRSRIGMAQRRLMKVAGSRAQYTTISFKYGQSELLRYDS